MFRQTRRSILSWTSGPGGADSLILAELISDPGRKGRPVSARSGIGGGGSRLS
jgi:hypothetical protein